MQASRIELSRALAKLVVCFGNFDSDKVELLKHITFKLYSFA